MKIFELLQISQRHFYALHCKISCGSTDILRLHKHFQMKT